MSNFTIFFSLRKNNHNRSCFSLSLMMVSQVNVFVQMQVDKYLYMVIENETIYSNGYAPILSVRPMRTGQEIVGYCGL